MRLKAHLLINRQAIEIVVTNFANERNKDKLMAGILRLYEVLTSNHFSSVYQTDSDFRTMVKTQREETFAFGLVSSRKYDDQREQ